MTNFCGTIQKQKAILNQCAFCAWHNLFRAGHIWFLTRHTHTHTVGQIDNKNRKQQQQQQKLFNDFFHLKTTAVAFADGILIIAAKRESCRVLLVRNAYIPILMLSCILCVCALCCGWYFARSPFSGSVVHSVGAQWTVWTCGHTLAHFIHVFSYFHSCFTLFCVRDFFGAVFCCYCCCCCYRCIVHFWAILNSSIICKLLKTNTHTQNRFMYFAFLRVSFIWDRICSLFFRFRFICSSSFKWNHFY